MVNSCSQYGHLWMRWLTMHTSSYYIFFLNDRLYLVISKSQQDFSWRWWIWHKCKQKDEKLQISNFKFLPMVASGFQWPCDQVYSYVIELLLSTKQLVYLVHPEKGPGFRLMKINRTWRILFRLVQIQWPDQGIGLWLNYLSWRLHIITFLCYSNFIVAQNYCTK